MINTTFKPPHILSLHVVDPSKCNEIDQTRLNNIFDAHIKNSDSSLPLCLSGKNICTLLTNEGFKNIASIVSQTLQTNNNNTQLYFFSNIKKRKTVSFALINATLNILFKKLRQNNSAIETNDYNNIYSILECCNENNINHFDQILIIKLLAALLNQAHNPIHKKLSLKTILLIMLIKPFGMIQKGSITHYKNLAPNKKNPHEKLCELHNINRQYAKYLFFLKQSTRSAQSEPDLDHQFIKNAYSEMVKTCHVYHEDLATKRFIADEINGADPCSSDGHVYRPYAFRNDEP